MFGFAYGVAQSLRGQGEGGTGTAAQGTVGSATDISRSLEVVDPSGVAAERVAPPDDRNAQNGESVILQPEAARTGGAVEIGRYPASGGTYIVTRSSIALPDGRVILLYNIWFQKDMLWFLGLPAWKELRKQVTVTVSPGELLEAQARYDRLVRSLAEGLADGGIRTDFAQALADTREAAKQEARDLATGYVVGKVQTLRRAGRVLSIADDAAQHADDAARAAGRAASVHKYAGQTVEQILRLKKGSIKNAPLPPGSPSWNEILNMTWEHIQEAARKNKPGFKTIYKLLTREEYNR